MTAATWRETLKTEKAKPYFQNILSFLEQERSQGKEVYPPKNQIFNAFRYTELGDVKVVIVGQDPYHEPGQAHGLSFSVPDGCAKPPSLQNIFKELAVEYPGYRIPESGNLENWARQGVFLLNATLTVQRGHANSHSGIGWAEFTDEVIRIINANVTGVVYMLWGRFARDKCSLVDAGRNLILTAHHPSPLSAYRGFFGCGHFVRANEYLIANGRGPINWQL
ncbi:MAG: uracil-DNA glycosylase [Succinivibrionaceae bacterium]|nr:uracil-DNA glycosylase [Succinivibrionaceae bacterium]